MGPILPTETLARYIFSKSHYSKAKGIVKYGAFMPILSTKGNETSVFRISSLSTTAMWDIGRDIVAKACERLLKGRADIFAYSVSHEGLTVQEDAGPHPLHANIIDWPEEESKRLEIARELARKAQLHLLGS